MLVQYHGATAIAPTTRATSGGGRRPTSNASGAIRKPTGGPQNGRPDADNANRPRRPEREQGGGSDQARSRRRGGPVGGTAPPEPGQEEHPQREAHRHEHDRVAIDEGVPRLRDRPPV